MPIGLKADRSAGMAVDHGRDHPYVLFGVLPCLGLLTLHFRNRPPIHRSTRLAFWSYDDR